MGRAGLEPALLQQELGPKPSAYANFATCPYDIYFIDKKFL